MNKNVSFVLLNLEHLDDYINLLKQLSNTIDNNYNNEKYKERMIEIQNLYPYYQVWLMINNSEKTSEWDSKLKNVIGCGTIIIEPKFIHELSSVAHIEDVCIDKNFQKLGYGKILLNQLKDIAIKEKCYKIILNCNKQNICFYEKCGFNNINTEMCIYLSK